jgi:hypothetical protein
MRKENNKVNNRALICLHKRIWKAKKKLLKKVSKIVLNLIVRKIYKLLLFQRKIVSNFKNRKLQVLWLQREWI